MDFAPILMWLNIVFGWISIFGAVISIGFSVAFAKNGWETDEEKMEVRSDVIFMFVTFLIFVVASLIAYAGFLAQLLLGLLVIGVVLEIAICAVTIVLAIFSGVVNIFRLFSPIKAEDEKEKNEEEKAKRIQLPDGILAEVIVDDGAMPEGYAQAK